ncbi:hypothetical protein [Bradyrhizobium prioriisuperbiae]|uniref:hypothetical protein n=1 Tax=Bradyrhizobium prioriisuperbiae TaxID=2854389 RepID=UPI0028EB49E1|nr:hypothetical protein [Bradyrhizobium prioritasuperba]
MTGKRIVVLVLAAVIAVAALWATQHKQLPSPPKREVSAAILKSASKETFFEMIAAYCKAHPDPSDLGSCAMCSSETCPTCGFGPERAVLVHQCNPGNWDCAGSLLFAPATGGSCAFAPNGGCQCPVGGVKKSEADSAKRLAALLRPAAPVAPLSLRQPQ